MPENDSHVGACRAEHAEWLEVTATPMLPEEVVETVVRATSASAPVLIGAHNLHSVYLSHTNARFAHFYRNADVTLVDGWPVLAALNAGRSKRGVSRLDASYRIGSTDWIPLAIAAPQVQRVCVVGASAASNSAFLERSRMLQPAKAYLGVPADPWSWSELGRVIDRVAQFDPDLVLVALGMPLQEEVAQTLAEHLKRGAIAPVGGAIDQMSGFQRHAPRWTGRLRIEWLWRLVSNPRRLFHRYLIEPIQLIRVLRRKDFGK